MDHEGSFVNSFNYCTPVDVLNAARTLSNKSSFGIDGIPNNIVKEFFHNF